MIVDHVFHLGHILLQLVILRLEAILNVALLLSLVHLVAQLQPLCDFATRHRLVLKAVFSFALARFHPHFDVSKLFLPRG